MRFMKPFIFVSVLVVFTVGCRQQDRVKSRGTTGAKNQDLDFLTVAEAPDELDKARRLAAQAATAPLSPAALEEIWDLSRDALPQDMPHDQVMTRLRQIVDDRTAGMRARTNAVCLMVLLDPDPGQSAILHLLRGADIKGKQELLITLGFMAPGALRITNRELQAELLALIANNEIGETAVRTCGSLAFPAVKPAFWAALPVADGLRKAEILFWLAELQPDRESLRACTAGLEQLKDRAHDRCLEALDRLLTSPDPALARDAAELIAGELLRFIAAGRVGPLDFPQSICADVLAKGNGPQARALAKTILARSKDGYLRDCAYVATRRWEGTTARSRIVQDLARPKEFQHALQACTVLYAGTGDSVVVRALLSQAKRCKNPELVLSIAQSLMAVGGSQVAADLSAIAEDLPEKQRKALLMALDEASPAELARRLAEAGIIATDDPQRFVAEIAARNKAYGVDFENDAGLCDLLTAAGILLGFDTETSEIPVRHDKLLMDLAKASGGSFRPEACYEKMLQKNSEDWDAPYSVQFIQGGRLYRFTARNFGDWYDVERVILVCNRALADAGSAKRFLQISEGGQVALFVCLTPEQAVVLAEQFHVQFEEALDAPMRQGKDYEEQARRDLYKN